MLKFAHSLERFPPCNLKEQHQRMNALIQKHNLDCVYINSQDMFVSEYNYLSNSQRFFVSNFSGSTGSGIFISEDLKKKNKVTGQFLLFLDGRYHLQGDQECDPQFVQLFKLNLSQGLDASILEWIENCEGQNLSIGFDAHRVPFLTAQKIKALCERKNYKYVPLMSSEISEALQIPGWNIDRAIEPVPEKFTGRNIAKNLKDLSSALPTPAKESCIITCASDDAAFLLNARGYHTPNASSLLGYCFAIEQDCILFLPDPSANSPVHIPAEMSTNGNSYRLTVIKRSFDDLKKALAKYSIKHVYFNGSSTNASLPMLAKEAWSQAAQYSDYKTLEHIRAVKTPEEESSIRDAFIRSSRAIAETLRWVKKCAAQNTRMSEADLSNKIRTEYGNQGALELSFESIAGIGPNGAIIHYTKANDQVVAKPSDLVLLDSGAYYEPGFATDCTRGAYFGNGEGAPQWQKEIYTLTVKSCVAGMMEEVQDGSEGAKVDQKCREVLREKGYDFAHGTGHGVGIHVHEGGIGLHSRGPVTLFPQGVTSIEPGIYLEGKGGVRIENVAIVKPHPSQPTKLVFDNLVKVGYDWDLMDTSLLSSEEKKYLKAYETECQKLGTSVTACPLI